MSMHTMRFVLMWEFFRLLGTTWWRPTPKITRSKKGSCDLDHSMGPYGENLAEGYGNLNGVDAVKMWVSEKPNYDYASNSCVGDECLHYT
ncbi:hypothetical protein Patl1_37279 [Pistacia atlantica]|nr:hypothetical protein Patl1_37279 [Pistacia atlantica]